MTFIENMMMRAPTSTAGKANINIWMDCFLKIYQSELNELSKIRGGKNINSIDLGSIKEIFLIDYPMMPVLLHVYPNPTLIKNNVGVYGIQEYIDRSFFIITAIVKPKNRNIKARASGLINP